MNAEARDIRVLIVEDSRDDAELLELELKASGYLPRVLRVETLQHLARELDTGAWDVILADYKLAGFTALEALEALKRSGRDIPFIIVSGSVGEETAVEAMKAGAHDFFLKDRLTRLNAAIEREVREAGIRRERRYAMTLLDNLYETAPIGLAFLDCDFRYIRINESLAAINGLEAPSHIGRTVSEVVPQLAGALEEKLRAVLATGEPIVNIEVSGETRAAPGTRRHWLVNYYPIRERDGTVLGVGSIVVETTDIQRAEQALIESDARKSAMLASAFDGIVAIDEQSRIIEFNPAAEKMFGYTRDTVLGKDMADLLMPARLRARHREGVRRFLQTGEGPVFGRVVEMPALRADGTEFPAELAITVIQGQKPHVFTGYVRDVSERQRVNAERERLLAELKQAVQARDEFLSIASHELKTPLTPLDLQLTTALELVRERRSVDSELERVESKLEKAKRHLERLTALINKLLDVTRITAGRYTISRSEVDLTKVVQSIAEQMQEAVRRSGSALRIIAHGPIIGSWDLVGVETVVTNLLGNALKFGEGRPIEISIDAHDDVARLSVTDHGIGVGPEEQKRIFQRFERAVSSQHYGGFGIGLWEAVCQPGS